MNLSNILTQIDKLNELVAEKEVKLENLDMTLSLRTLSAEEDTLMHIDLEEYKGIEYFKQTQLKNVCYALKRINGEELPEFIYDEENDEKISRVRFVEKNIMSKLPDMVIQRLFKAYASLLSETDKKIADTIRFEGEEDVAKKMEEFEKKISEQEMMKEMQNKSREESDEKSEQNESSE